MFDSTGTLRRIFETALLSRAAYANLDAVTYDDREKLLASLAGTEPGSASVMSTTAASYLARHFGVVHHQPNTTYGYSGTLFRRRDLAQGDPTNGFVLAIRGTEASTWDDLRADLLQIIPSGVAWHQRAALKLHWEGLLSGNPEYGLEPAVHSALAAGRIHVAGHSLGGHLALWFANDSPLHLERAYTFNAPGVTYAFRHLIERERISNIVSDSYPDVVAGLYQTFDAPDRFFIESGSPLEFFSGHSLPNLLHGIAGAYLLSLIDPGLPFDQIRSLMEGVAHVGDRTYEQLASILRRSFGLADPATEVEGDVTIFGLIAQFESGALPSGRIVTLAGTDAADIALRAAADGTEGAALRHALVHALPFAIVGAGAADHAVELPAGTLSDAYLSARSEYVLALVARNIADVVIPGGLEPGVVYRDLPSGTVLASPHAYAGQPGQYRQVIFGTPGDDAVASLTGGGQDDRIFGGVGSDVLDGGAGNDVLDGGAGDDILGTGEGRHDTLIGGAGHDLYLLDAGARRVTIIDVDGAGVIAVRQQAGPDQILGGDLKIIPGDESGAVDVSGNLYRLSGNDLQIALTDGRFITIRNHVGGALGIDLPEGPAPGLPAPAPGVPTFIVSAENPDGSNAQGERLRTLPDIPEYLSPHARIPYDGGLQGDALAGEFIDISQASPAAGFLSIGLLGGLGDSHLVGSPYRDAIVDDGNVMSVIGTFWASAERAGNDVLIGAGGDDVLESHGGDDQLFGGDGDDLLIDIPVRYLNSPFTSDVNWVLEGGHTNRDRLFGETGNDILVAGAGQAHLDGGAGDDELYGGAHDDVLIGGAGHDVLSGDSRAVAALWHYAYPAGVDLTLTLDGRIMEESVAPGSDFLDGGDGNDHLIGGGGDDHLVGGAGDDVLQGDTLFIPAGSRALSGNHGLTPEHLHGNDELHGGEGNDALHGGGGDDFLFGGAGLDHLYGGGGDDWLEGGADADYLVGDDATGTQGHDTLHGGDGDDTLFGMSGNDRLEGGAGSDTLVGGEGDDVLDGGPGDDYSATGPTGLYGQGGNDILRGGSGKDRLQGGDGDDRLEAGTGGDLLFGEAGDDLYVLGSGAGAVQIMDTQGTNHLLFSADVDPDGVSITMSGGLISLRYSDDDHVLMDPVTLAAFGITVFENAGSLDTEALLHRFQPGSAGSDRSLRLGAGVAASEIGLRRWNDDLLLTYAGPVANWADTSTLPARNILHRSADGGEYGLEPGVQVINLVNWYQADPTLYLSRLRDFGGTIHELPDRAAVAPATFVGSAADDALEGTAFDDVIAGMHGNDLMLGGAGSDTYHVEVGAGHDIVLDEGGSADILSFGAGIIAGDLVVTEQPEGLLIRFTGRADQSVLLADWSGGSAGSIDGIHFADGTLLDRDAIDALNVGNHSPRVAGDIPDRTLFAGQSFSIVLPAAMFTDVDPDDGLHLLAFADPGVMLPSWLAFDPATATLSGTALPEHAGSIGITVMAVDDGGLSAWHSFGLSVVAPVWLQGTDQGETLSPLDSASSHHILGMGGNDFLFGGSGPDILEGGTGDDQLSGSGGDDALHGGEGNDFLFGDDDASGTGNDLLYGGPGNDIIRVGFDRDVAHGGEGNDVLFGSPGRLVGTELQAGEGSLLYGGPGNDVYHTSFPVDVIVELPDEGIDTAYANYSFVLGEHIERLYLEGGGNLTGVGNGLDNELFGGGGSDHLIGGAGHDLLDGGEAADLMDGGEGDDVYVVDHAGDVVIDAGGTDAVRSYVSYVLPQGIEHLVLAGSQPVNGTGNAGDNVLTGNSRANRLDGGAGADLMAGGAGDDTYIVDHPGDQVIEHIAEGIDTVFSTVDWVLGPDIERLFLTGSASLPAVGNALDNVLGGNAGNNILDGRSGADSMSGGGGDDVYHVDSPGDAVIEAPGEGMDIVLSAMETHTLAGNVEILFLHGSAAANGIGNGSANLVRGNEGFNWLSGAGGIDILEGGGGMDSLVDSGDRVMMNGGDGDDGLAGTTGNDLLVGARDNDSISTGSGADVILFNRGDGQDTVMASTGQDNTLSLGGGIRLADLQFQRDGKDLILLAGGTDRIRFTDYLAKANTRSIDRLQIVLEGGPDYQPESTDSLRNRRIQSFDFDALVAAFTAAGKGRQGVSTWNLLNAMPQSHWGGSDAAAVGGDLAYRYGLAGSLSGISFGPALGVLSAASFGSAPQILQPLPALQDASVRLM